MMAALAGQSEENSVVEAIVAGASDRSIRRKPSLAKSGTAVVVRRNTLLTPPVIALTARCRIRRRAAA
jgi:hypothetical protein